jgi:hypothetical protein
MSLPLASKIHPDNFTPFVCPRRFGDPLVIRATSAIRQTAVSTIRLSIHRRTYLEVSGIGIQVGRRDPDANIHFSAGADVHGGHSPQTIR